MEEAGGTQCMSVRLECVCENHQLGHGATPSPSHFNGPGLSLIPAVLLVRDARRRQDAILLTSCVV